MGEQANVWFVLLSCAATIAQSSEYPPPTRCL